MSCLELQRLAVLIISSLGIVAAQAAPTATDAATASSVDEPAATARPAAAGNGTNNDKQTLNLLVDLQPKTAGFEFRNRTTGSVSQVPRASTTGSQGVGPNGTLEGQPNAAGLFGAGATPEVTRSTETRVQNDWQPAMQPVNSGMEPAPSDASMKFSLLLPRAWVAFIRENREWVVGGVLLSLAVVWMASASLARRRG